MDLVLVRRKQDSLNAFVDMVISYLTNLFMQGLSYFTISTAWSAVSNFLKKQKKKVILTFKTMKYVDL